MCHPEKKGAKVDIGAYRNVLFVLLARELSASHGVFFAAAFLADFGLPLPVALDALSFTRGPCDVVDARSLG
jgi:hypothetical protein